MRLIITRPAAQGLAWQQELRQLGVDAVSLPLIDIAPTHDSSAVLQAWACLESLRLVVFVSGNAVAHFFALRPTGLSWPSGLLAGATGPGTSAALRSAGLPPSCIVEPDAGGPFDSEALWLQLSARDWVGSTVLVVRGEGGRDWLAQHLRAAGAEVDFVAAYRREPPRFDVEALALMQAAQDQPGAFCWHFSSSEALGYLLQARPEARWGKASALATHPRIVEAALSAGFGCVSLVGVRATDIAAYFRAGQMAKFDDPAR